MADFERAESELLERDEVEKLREKCRDVQLIYRENRRNFILSLARFMSGTPPENQTTHDMTELAKSLKSKGSITQELLNNVMNGLLDGKDNITKFLKVDGALQALLRLLSGQNEKFQLISAQCLCNLALGDEKETSQVLKASESYLMAHLSGRNPYLAEACLIALGNLSRQSIKNVKLLMSQGFFTKIINLLNNDDQSLIEAAVYALSLFVYHGFDILRPEDAEMCLDTIHTFKNEMIRIAFLLSIISSCKFLHSQFISHQIHSEVLKNLFNCLKEGHTEALYFLRAVSNFISEESGIVARDYVESHGDVFQQCINLMLQSEKEYLIKECLGLIGNLVNHPVEMVKMFGMQLVMEKMCLLSNMQLKKFK